MRILTHGLDLGDFFNRLSRSTRRLLLLDYDGTLAPFRVERDQAFPYDGARRRLERLLSTPGSRVVVVSGRAVEDLLPLLGLSVRPEIVGSHGWERLLPNGEYRLEPLPEPARRGLERARAWAAAQALGERFESKPASVALHLRGLEQKPAADLLQAAQRRWSKLTGDGLELHEFDGGIELRIPGRNKGDAVRELLSQMGRQVVAAYLGDDRTDEDAFRVMKGRGLSVLVRSDYRDTEADLWIRPPEELFEFLDSWEEAVQEK